MTCVPTTARFAAATRGCPRVAAPVATANNNNRNNASHPRAGD
ncbi:hypothetical protein GCM10025759_21310 [Lysobacter panacisoli]|uniref:Uncharacterized protein n=1 Tax=Lysobacter panacisoli TaxID=1255263 RepID=A0ABP9LHL2_9GAMM